MPVIIRPVTTKSQLRKFVRFNYWLYKDNPYSVPDLMFDTLNTLDHKKNAAFEFCEARYFLAYKDNEIVGRIAAIINHKANAKWNVRTVRFGWIDFVDDLEVSSALLDAVMKWGKERGMNTVEGPFGFTDFDPEGMLIEGFDQLGTMAEKYCYPYYQFHMEKLGFKRTVTWVEKKVTVPEAETEKHIRIAEVVKQRYHLRTLNLRHSIKKLAKRYGKAIFQLINETYSELYGYSELSDRQMQQYIKMYLGFVDYRMVSAVVDENDELAAIGISMPSLSKALQRSGGVLFPFGWWYLLKALTFGRSDTLDLLLVAVKPEYQNKGVNALIMVELANNYIKMGFKHAETNVELESNVKVQSMWNSYEHIVHKRRCAFGKQIE